MKIVTGFDELNTVLPKSTPCSCMIGKFDGIHRGHELLAKRVAAKKNTGMTSILLTFDMSPRSVVNGETPRELITMDERKYLFRSLGIDIMLILPFTDDLMHLSPEAFLDELASHCNLKYLVAGTDFRFGYKGSGDVSLLKRLSREKGFSFEMVEKLQEDGRDISSTYLREEITKGNIELVNDLLGYPYFVAGTILHGNHIGTGLGVPTINLEPPVSKLLPPNGVYFTTVEIDGHKFYGVSNVGVKPTVNKAAQTRVENAPRPNVETHILNFQKNVYEKDAVVSFYHFSRPEQKFDSLDELKQTIFSDRKAAFQFFNLQSE